MLSHTYLYFVQTTKQKKKRKKQILCDLCLCAHIYFTSICTKYFDFFYYVEIYRDTQRVNNNNNNIQLTTWKYSCCFYRVCLFISISSSPSATISILLLLLFLLQFFCTMRPVLCSLNFLFFFCSKRNKIYWLLLKFFIVLIFAYTLCSIDTDGMVYTYTIDPISKQSN